jgi:DNA-binding NtrC family response regulator
MTAKRILVIDDEPYILKSLQYLLEDEYEVDTASGGEEALKKIGENGNYDLLLCDLAMPDINGATLFLKIAKQYPHMEKRVIFMTGGPFGGYVTESFGSAHPCIAKPFENEELHKIIKKFFRDMNS